LVFNDGEAKKKWGLNKKRLELRLAFNDGEAKKKWGNFSQGTEPKKKCPKIFLTKCHVRLTSVIWSDKNL
jgi:hypothetical protein